MTETTLKICICGAGSASHVFAGWLASKGFHVNMFTNFEDEATRLNEVLQALNCNKHHMYFSVSAARIKALRSNFPTERYSLESQTRYRIRPSMSFQVISTIFPPNLRPRLECNFVLLPVPSLAYEPILRDIKDHLSKGTLLGATPAR
jgi:hypothetical protein